MDDWKNNFKAYALKTNFQIGLTRPQLEYLCAVADDVVWDRFQLGSVHYPRNFIASEGALTKRGLVQRKKERKPWTGAKVHEITSTCQLTDAGWLIVELLKITGIFLKADNAIERRAEKVVKLRKR